MNFSVIHFFFIDINFLFPVLYGLKGKICVRFILFFLFYFATSLQKGSFKIYSAKERRKFCVSTAFKISPGIWNPKGRLIDSWLIVANGRLRKSKTLDVVCWWQLQSRRALGPSIARLGSNAKSCKLSRWKISKNFSEIWKVENRAENCTYREIRFPNLANFLFLVNREKKNQFQDSRE